MNKGEIYAKAESVLKKRRFDAVALNQNRIDEINRVIPEISEINKQLFNTSHEIYKIIASGQNVQAKIEELKKSNIEAQLLIKATLRNYNYPTDYLEIQYHCTDCNDTGYNNGEFCHCFKEIVGKLSAEEMNRNSQLKLYTFDSFKLSYYHGEDYTVMASILQQSKDFVKNFGNPFDVSGAKNIIMSGNTGLGKTHISLAIANELIKKGYSVVYDTAINILHKIESEHYNRYKDDDTLQLVNETDLLIIDDLGTEQDTAFNNSAVYNIINTRLNLAKSTIISTNLSFKRIAERYSARVQSRLMTYYICMVFKGKDIRYQIKKVNL